MKGQDATIRHHKVWLMYITYECNLLHLDCPSCNRYINTKTVRFGSRLCFRLQARST